MVFVFVRQVGVNLFHIKLFGMSSMVGYHGPRFLAKYVQGMIPRLPGTFTRGQQQWFINNVRVLQFDPDWNYVMYQNDYSVLDHVAVLGSNRNRLINRNLGTNFPTVNRNVRRRLNFDTRYS